MTIGCRAANARRTAGDSPRAAISEAFYDALPYTLVVVYSWSPMAYMKGFSVFICDDFSALPPLAHMLRPPPELFLRADYRVRCDHGDAAYQAVLQAGWAVIGVFGIASKAGINKQSYFYVLWLFANPAMAHPISGAACCY